MSSGAPPGLDTTYRPRPLPPLPADAHKGVAGRVLSLCGCRTMPGAASFVLRAAQRAGAGLVYHAVLDAELLRVLPLLAPEAVYLDLSSSRSLFASRLPGELPARPHDARVCGPGLGTSDLAKALVDCTVDAEFTGPLVLDADGLNLLGGTPERLHAHAGPVVITPHPGEASRLLERPVGSGEEERVEAALELARRSRAVVVLKGHGTVVAHVDADGRERAVRNGTGNPAMATAGSGDVLSGILAAYAAAWRVRLEPHGGTLFDAVCAAVHVHGLAGDLARDELGEEGVVATDLLAFLPRAQRAFRAEG